MNQVKKRILIVDDEESLTWSIAKNLQKQYIDFEVHAKNSGEEALMLLKQLPFNLVISDIQMPGISGLEILKYVKKYLPDLPIIMMTSLDNPEIKRLADQASEIYYFEKPFDIGELKKTINTILKKRCDHFEIEEKILPVDKLIRKNYHEKFNGFVTIRNSNKTGVLHFQSGEITNAWTENFEGELALINVLSWKNVDYNVVQSNVPIQKTIHYGWKLIIEDEMAKVV